MHTYDIEIIRLEERWRILGFDHGVPQCRSTYVRNLE